MESTVTRVPVAAVPQKPRSSVRFEPSVGFLASLGLRQQVDPTGENEDPDQNDPKTAERDHGSEVELLAGQDDAGPGRHDQERDPEHDPVSVHVRTADPGQHKVGDPASAREPRERSIFAHREPDGGMKFDEFVLAASTADLADEPTVRDRADVVEFRMDLASDPLSALSEYDGTLPLVATNRTEREGGDAAPGEERIRTLRRALEYPAVAAVDVELAAVRSGPGRQVLEASTDVATIVSVHDFEGTPDRERLRELLEGACDRGTVGKLAVTASSAADVLDLLAVTHELSLDGRTVATMAMGEAGRHSRAVAPIYGSKIGYAPADDREATAPGQYDLSTLAELIDRLAGDRDGPDAD